MTAPALSSPRSFAGDGAAALRGLADDYDRRLDLAAESQGAAE